MRLYKLTDKDGFTMYETQWGECVTHAADGDGKYLCSDGFIHAYTHPLIAVLMNPIHANITNPQLWEAEGDVVLSDPKDAKPYSAVKVGCKSLTTLRQMPLPTLTIEQRVEIAIRCAKEVCNDSKWNKWADKWLSGDDRSYAAYATAYTDAAAYAAAYAAAAADAAYAAYAAYADADDAYYAATNADAAAAAAAAHCRVNLVEIIEKVVKGEE